MRRRVSRTRSRAAPRGCAAPHSRAACALPPPLRPTAGRATPPRRLSRARQARAICGARLPEEQLRRLTRKRVELEREVLLAGGEDGGSESEGDGDAGVEVARRTRSGSQQHEVGRSRSQPQPSTVPFDVAPPAGMGRSLSAHLLHGEAGR